MLSKSRIVLQGNSEYPWEADALRFIREQLPDTDPYYVWELVELVDASKGRLHEIDCLVLGYSAVYLVEIKSRPGVYTGNSTDWYVTSPGERTRYMDPPYRLTNLKAKILKTLLDRKLPQGMHCPWVQPLVFLSAEHVRLELDAPGRQCVVTRENLKAALTFHQMPGVDVASRPSRITAPQIKAVGRALEQIGIRQSEGTRRVGSYKLGSVREEGPGYEDRDAQHAERSEIRRRARIYLVPQQTTADTRQTLLRAADREASLLEALKDHPGILRSSDYVPDSPLGPTVLFDYFEGVPLDAFMRSHPNLPFDTRTEIIHKVALALAYCHSKEIIHGGLSPSAVLVREASDGNLDVKIYNFQLGGTASGTSTVHWSSLAAVPWGAYQAPELRENPQARSPASDLFSLGALAYYVLTGRAPGASGADVDRKLTAKLGSENLDPRSVDDQISPRLAEAICIATELKPINRADDVNEWLDIFFLDALTAPSVVAAAPEIDPLQAKRGDALGEDLTVERVLGQGASSRVLQVKRASDERSYALKVALSSDEDPRLDAEAAVLDRLRHNNIVQFEERRVLAGRTCILMTLAGETTLSRQLTQQGALSLDFAARYGEDLLLGLQYLEEEGILHRDIKPGNLGVGTAVRGAYHLTLFDFSLAFDVKLTEEQLPGLGQLGIGTAVYRDPYLRLRGAWDFAADRWSAAVTLHEMLAGARPSFEPEGAAIAPDSKLVLAAERFDATVRDQLVTFFQRALHRESAARFDSAKTMRREWNLAFEIPKHASSAATPTVAQRDFRRDEWTPAELAGIALDAPVASLPLSSRALNGLDRAGLTLAADLLQLPDNRLSAVRGVGTEVAKEILAFRNQWRDASPAELSEQLSFLPGYEGRELPLAELGLRPAVQRVFRDAGIGDLRLLASAPRRQVESLAARAGQSVPELTKSMKAAQAEAVGSEHPTSVAAWLQALLPKQKKRRHHLEVLFGLADPLLGNFEAPMAAVAAALGITRGGLSVVVTTTVSDWAAHPAFAELQLLMHSLVDAATPALPVRQLARALLARFADADEESPLKLARAAALARIVAAVEREQDGGLRWVRIGERPWILTDAAHGPCLRELGRLADDLAKREVLASPGEAARVLRAAVEHTTLTSATDEQLTAWAAFASEIAARSSRLEIYPKGLSNKRALELTSPALSGSLTVARVLNLVSSRYPDAEPLPGRPELDALLEPFGLKWRPGEQLYARPGESSYTLHSVSGTRLPTSVGTLPSSQREIDPIAVEMRDFEDRMRSAIQERKLRVLAASKTHAVATALGLRDAFGLTLVDLDQLLTGRLFAFMKARGISEDDVFTADRNGNDGSEDWAVLTSFMQDTADQVAASLFPVARPTLLIQPGLLARFGLKRFIAQLIEAQQSPHCAAACFLLLPGFDQQGAPVINGELVLSEISPTDVIPVSLSWLKKRAAA